MLFFFFFYNLTLIRFYRKCIASMNKVIKYIGLTTIVLSGRFEALYTVQENSQVSAEDTRDENIMSWTFKRAYVAESKDRETVNTTQQSQEHICRTCLFLVYFIDLFKTWSHCRIAGAWIMRTGLLEVILCLAVVKKTAVKFINNLDERCECQK